MAQGTLFIRRRDLDLQSWLVDDIQLTGSMLGTNADLVLTRLLDALTPGAGGVAGCVLRWEFAGDGAREEVLMGGDWGRGHQPRARGSIG